MLHVLVRNEALINALHLPNLAGILSTLLSSLPFISTTFKHKPATQTTILILFMFYSNSFFVFQWVSLSSPR